MRRGVLPGLWLAALTVLGGCGPRQVDVRTAPDASRAADLSIHLTNSLGQAVNVYVTNGGPDMFVQQVAANSTEQIPVQGIASGSTVTLKATTEDGRNTYSKTNVTLIGTYDWRIP